MTRKKKQMPVVIILVKSEHAGNQGSRFPAVGILWIHAVNTSMIVGSRLDSVNFQLSILNFEKIKTNKILWNVDLSPTVTKAETKHRKSLSLSLNLIRERIKELI